MPSRISSYIAQNKKESKSNYAEMASKQNFISHKIVLYNYRNVKPNQEIHFLELQHKAASTQVLNKWTFNKFDERFSEWYFQEPTLKQSGTTDEFVCQFQGLLVKIPNLYQKRLTYVHRSSESPQRTFWNLLSHKP